MKPGDTRVVLDPMDERRWRIVIPGKPTGGLMFLALFALCWLAGWAIGEVFALRALYSKRDHPGIDVSLWIWFLGWTIGGVGAMWLLRRVLGLAFGVESLILDPERVKWIRGLWGSTSIREYATPRIERFEAGGWRGLRFVSEGKAVHFGAGLDADERAWLLGELSRILAEVQGRG